MHIKQLKPPESIMSTLFHYWETRYKDKIKNHSNLSTLDVVLEEIFPDNAIFMKVAYYDDNFNEWRDIEEYNYSEQIQIYEDQVASIDSNEKKIRYHMWLIIDDEQRMFINLSTKPDEYRVHYDRWLPEPDNITIKHYLELEKIIELLKSMHTYKSKIFM